MDQNIRFIDHVVRTGQSGSDGCLSIRSRSESYFLEFLVKMLLIWSDNDERTDNMRYCLNPMRTSNG